MRDSPVFNGILSIFFFSIFIYMLIVTQMYSSDPPMSMIPSTSDGLEIKLKCVNQVEYYLDQWKFDLTDYYLSKGESVVMYFSMIMGMYYFVPFIISSYNNYDEKYNIKEEKICQKNKMLSQLLSWLREKRLK